MSAKSSGLDRIVEQMREPIQQYANLVQGLAGDNALALTLYDAIAKGIFDTGRHVVRNALVLKTVDLELLRRLAQQGRKLGKVRISAPLIMTPEYIKASLDVFPLELIEIQQGHLTVFGEDYFEGLLFEDAHVRMQCERELKSILIGMRQGLLSMAGRDKFIGAVKADVAERLVRTLRGMLWLKGQKDARADDPMVGEVEKLIERSLSGLRQALDVSGRQDWDSFKSLYRDVEHLGKIVDAW